MMINLSTLLARIQNDTGLSPILGAEIEFYLPQPPDAALREAFALEEERGHLQYETQLPHHGDAALLAQQLIDIRTRLIKEAGADFTAKPYPDQPGSAIHIHISMAGGAFAKQQDGEESPLLLHAIAGLCATMREAMPYFAPHPASYARFVPHVDAPTHISWGGNNRTTAIRIPDSAPEDRRIEHRIAGSDSDPVAVIGAILAGIHYGLVHHLTPPVRIYGNAFDSHYGLEALPSAGERVSQDILKAYETL